MAHLGNCIAMMDEGIGRLHEVIPQLPAEQATLCRLMLMVGARMDEGLEETFPASDPVAVVRLT